MWYSVYYIHTETFIILAAFLFQIFPKCQNLPLEKTKYQLITVVKTFVKNVMKVRLWGNLRVTSSKYCKVYRFWTECTIENGWFECKLKLNRRQSNNNNNFRCCFPVVYNCLHRQWNKRNYSTPISEMFCTFLREKNASRKTSRWMSAKKLVSEGAASWKPLQKMGISVGNSHTSVASDWTYRCFHVRNNIVRSFDWLELICVWKFTTAFWWVFLSMYSVYNKLQGSSIRVMVSVVHLMYVIVAVVTWPELTLVWVLAFALLWVFDLTESAL